MWVTRYLHLRKELKDGDVIAFDGETLVDDVIVSSHHLQYVSHERLVDIRYNWFLHSYYPPHNRLKSICLNAHHITSHLFVPARELHALRKVNSLSCEVAAGCRRLSLEVSTVTWRLCATVYGTKPCWVSCY